MKIRRYMGKDTQEAILKVKMDLGSEAIILNTRKVKQKGIKNFFSKPLIEVLAAIDDYGVKKEGEKPKNLDKSVKSKTILEEKEEKIDLLENRVNSMESLLQKIYDEVKTNEGKNLKQGSEKEELKSIVNNDHQHTYLRIIEHFETNLTKNEVDPAITKKLIETVKTKLNGNITVNETTSMFYRMIHGILGKPDTIQLRDDGKPTKVIFLGPTGVGKTTTLAKIAANYALNLKKKVGLITSDTYRIAAVEQLKTYAEILGMPVEVIYSLPEMQDAIGAYQDKDLILIDTAGRSYKNKSQFDELKALVDYCEPDEVFLVLSTTSGIRNCDEVVKQYGFLKDYKLIFTKLDESPALGVILNTRKRSNKSLSYVTVGQSVPDDIEVADIDKIAKNILGSMTL
jgi:flagellar biosynthesis protein FlhF